MNKLVIMLLLVILFTIIRNQADAMMVKTNKGYTQSKNLCFKIEELVRHKFRTTYLRLSDNRVVEVYQEDVEKGDFYCPNNMWSKVVKKEK